MATTDAGIAAIVVSKSAANPALYVANSSGPGASISSEAGDGLDVTSQESGYGINATSNGGGDGVEGYDSFPSAGEAGVLGLASGNSSTGSSIEIYAGVWGDNGVSAGAATPVWPVGVLGSEDDAHAGVFLNDSQDYATLYVSNFSSGGTGQAASLFKTFMAKSADGTCGMGSGGSLSCTGQIKTLVPAGGGARKVETYAVQSPENWMEDFGSGELKKGVALVTIDPAFAETVSEDNSYHVFITPNGDSKSLYVIARTATTFEVRESGGGTSSLSFDYRIVAKRRGFETQRLVDVTERFNAELKAAIIPRSSGTRPAHPQLAKSAVTAALGLHPSKAGRAQPTIKPAAGQGSLTQR
jgi:hypothetical protein